MPESPSVHVQVVVADALTYPADVLVLKHAQGLYGVDSAAFRRLCSVHESVPLPRSGVHSLVASLASLGAARVLYIGVESLSAFGYGEIRDFGRRALAILGGEPAPARHVALTLHGVGYGLDEVESFKAELAGVLEAIAAGEGPRGLAEVSFVERDARRAARLSATLDELLPGGRLRANGASALANLGAAAQDALGSAGHASAAKPHVFVAMPFAAEMDDVFHYGIQGAINASGMLAERADLAAFTGDVMGWVKARIASANLVVADLSSANPNVYLEVGYAWGRGVATVLLTRQGDELKFDVRGQRCIVYASIKDLESKLARELAQLPLG